MHGWRTYNMEDILKSINDNLLLLNGRFDKVEQRLDKFEQRLDKFEQRLDKFEQEQDRSFKTIVKLLSEMNRENRANNNLLMNILKEHEKRILDLEGLQIS